jgi:hypothetical protein
MIASFFLLHNLRPALNKPGSVAAVITEYFDSQTFFTSGCAEKQIMAISGHATSKELLRYTKAADQIRLAQAAMAKMINQITGAEFIHRGDESTFTAQSG